MAANTMGQIQNASMLSTDWEPQCSGHPDLDRAAPVTSSAAMDRLRQWCKLLTRLTYALSKSVDNLRAALALHFAYYNLCSVHSSLRVTPAMEAGSPITYGLLRN